MFPVKINGQIDGCPQFILNSLIPPLPKSSDDSCRIMSQTNIFGIMACPLLHSTQGDNRKMADGNNKSNILKELARRRVFQSAGAYIVVTWVVVQVGSIIFPEFGAPEWAMRALIVFLIVAFPPTMMVAWTIDVSNKGFTRTPESGYSRATGNWPRLTMVLAATAMSAGVLWWVWDDYIMQPGQTRSTIKSQPVVAVNSPRNIVGKSDSQWLGDAVATMIRSALAESRHVIILSQARWDSLTANASNRIEMLNVAKKIGVDYVIDGDYVETRNGIVLTTRIEDVENNAEIHSASSNEKDISGIIASVPELSIRIKQALRVPHQENVGMFEADFAIENLAAYEAYITGLAYLIDFEYQAAEDALGAALTIAPNFHIARFRLAQMYEATSRTTLAQEMLNAIPMDADLSERLRLYIEGARAYFVADRDPQKAIEVYSRLVELYPYEMEAGTNLAEAYWLDFQEDAAIDEFRRLTEIHDYDPTSWMSLGERLLDVGKLVEAKETLEKYAAMRPDDSYAFALLGNLALLQGDLPASSDNHKHALELRPGFVAARIGLARSHYLQGDVPAARSLWQSVVSDENVAAGFRIDAAFDLAGVLRGRGLFEESLKPLLDTMTIIEEEGLRTAMALSQLASTQLELRDLERAQTLIDESVRIAPVPVTRYLFAQGMLELRLERFDQVGSVVAQIRSIAEAAEDFDQDMVSAANYLAGLSALQQGDLRAATGNLQAAVDQADYQYAVYKVGLALLYRATGDLDVAAKLAAEASIERDPGDLRLDLELDRARAQLLHAEILAERGARNDAREQAHQFLERWQMAAPELPEIQRANELLTTI
jgi:tetratricopeptide (TPR) repeat protein